MKYLWTGCMVWFFVSLIWVLWDKFGENLPDRVFGSTCIGIFGVFFCSYMYVKLDSWEV